MAEVVLVYGWGWNRWSWIFFPFHFSNTILTVTLCSFPSYKNGDIKEAKGKVKEENTRMRREREQERRKQVGSMGNEAKLAQGMHSDQLNKSLFCRRNGPVQNDWHVLNTSQHANTQFRPPWSQGDCRHSVRPLTHLLLPPRPAQSPVEKQGSRKHGLCMNKAASFCRQPVVSSSPSLLLTLSVLSVFSLILPFSPVFFSV